MSKLFLSLIGIATLTLGSITTDGLKIHQIIEGGPGLGVNVSKFNEIISEYFHIVFGSGGDQYLENFPTVKSGTITDSVVQGRIKKEIDELTSPYRSGVSSSFSAVVNGGKRRVPDEPKIQIHLLMGLLRITTFDFPQKTQTITEFFRLSGTDGIRDSRNQIDKDRLQNVIKMIAQMNSMFGDVGKEVSAKYLELIDSLSGAPIGIDSSEVFITFRPIAWSFRKNQTAKLLGAVLSAIDLCRNTYARKWNIQPIICEGDFGGKFLIDIFTQISKLYSDRIARDNQIIASDMPIWYVFNADFIVNRLDANPGPNIRWTVFALLEIFKSNLKNFLEIARAKESFVVNLFKDFVQYPVGDSVGPLVDASTVNRLEDFLGNQISAICNEASKLNTTVIMESQHCQNSTPSNTN